VWLAARALATIEHLGAIAEQAERVGLEVRWLDLGDQEGIAEAIRSFTSSQAPVIRISNSSALRRRIRRTPPAAIWIQTPYPEHYPDWFWDASKGISCYAGYGLTLSTWTAGLYGLETYRSCAAILAESATVRDNYIDNGVLADRVILCGNPLLFELRRRMGDAPPTPFAVLWAPHWTEDWFGQRGYSRWRETVHPLLIWACDHPDSRILLRPHPLLPDGIAALPDSDEDAAAYRRLVALPNTTVSAGPLLDDILASAALITDGVSIIAYWSSTGRPLGITRDSESPPFNATGEALCAAAEILPTPGAVASWLSVLEGRQTDVALRELSERLHPVFAESPIAMWNACRD
jgi:hypothetical protein